MKNTQQRNSWNRRELLKKTLVVGGAVGLIYKNSSEHAAALTS